MKKTHYPIFGIAVVMFLANGTGLFAQAHFSPGVASIRDYTMPEPGFYGVLYNYMYTTDRLNDNNGNKISSITIAPGPGEGITLNVNVNVDIYALAPAFIWVSDWKVAGARYGAYISPSFSNARLRLGRDTIGGESVSIEKGQFAPGDLYVQPLWLSWGGEHLDVTAGYGFYAPVGKYNVRTYDVPLFGPIKVADADNIGLGFWTHEMQGSLSLYPWENKAMAIANTLTYEINGEQRDFDYTPGSYLTWNWGLSQYLPLTKNQNLMLEAGPAGYSQWQVSDDSGSDVRNQGIRGAAHAAGFQAGISYVPWNFSASFRYLNEFSAKNRFQGQSLGLNIAKKF